MIYLIIGTKNSGKSELAEKLAMESGDSDRYYLATMKIYDEAGSERVEKHRKQRAGKGFITIEQEYNIPEILSRIQNPKESTVLLECVSNLVGNELYENPVWKESLLDYIKSDDIEKRKQRFSEYITDEIKQLSAGVKNLVIVTNEYESEAEGYDSETRLYVELLHRVNEKIAELSDEIHDLRKER